MFRTVKFPILGGVRTYISHLKYHHKVTWSVLILSFFLTFSTNSIY